MNLESLEAERRSETICYWMIDCPETEKFGEVDITALGGRKPYWPGQLEPQVIDLWSAGHLLARVKPKGTDEDAMGNEMLERMVKSER